MSEALQNRRSDRIRKLETDKNFVSEAHKIHTPRKRHISTDSTSTVDSKYQLRNGNYI